MAVTVYGSSDDLIELEGDIREEFNVYGDDAPSLVAFSNGVVLRVRYEEDGYWRINQVAGDPEGVSITAATDLDEDYSDRATLHEDQGGDSAHWAVLSSQMVRAKE